MAKNMSPEGRSPEFIRQAKRNGMISLLFAALYGAGGPALSLIGSLGFGASALMDIRNAHRAEKGKMPISKLNVFSWIGG